MRDFQFADKLYRAVGWEINKSQGMEKEKEKVPPHLSTHIGGSWKGIRKINLNQKIEKTLSTTSSLLEQIKNW